MAGAAPTARANAPGPKRTGFPTPAETTPPPKVRSVRLALVGGTDYVVIADEIRVGWMRRTPTGWRCHDASSAMLAHTQGHELAAAAQTLLGAAWGHPVRVAQVSVGSLLHVETTAHALQGWSLMRGRVQGREDVLVRGRIAGWLQPAPHGRWSAHTTEGPVPAAPARTRTDAALDLLAHLVAPAPLPDLGPQAHTPRRPTARPKHERDLCPYTVEQLARYVLAEAADSQPGARAYRVQVAGDDVGYVRRARRRGRPTRAWEAGRLAPLDPQRPDPPLITRASVREDAVLELLADKLWAKAAEAIIHHEPQTPA